MITIPKELLDEVFREVSTEPSTLIHCAAVCRLWQALVYPYIFSRFKCDTHRSPLGSCIRDGKSTKIFDDLLTFFQQHPLVCSCIKELYLVDRGAASAGTLRAGIKLLTLESILTLLPQIRVLHLEMDRIHIPLVQPDAPGHIPRRINIGKLVLRDLKISMHQSRSNHNDWVRVFDLFNMIQELHLERVRCPGKQYASLEKRLSVAILSLRNTDVPNLQDIIDPLVLRQMSVYSSRFQWARGLSMLAQEASRNLETLDIGVLRNVILYDKTIPIPSFPKLTSLRIELQLPVLDLQWAEDYQPNWPPISAIRTLAELPSTLQSLYIQINIPISTYQLEELVASRLRKLDWASIVQPIMGLTALDHLDVHIEALNPHTAAWDTTPIYLQWTKEVIRDQFPTDHRVRRLLRLSSSPETRP